MVGGTTTPYRHLDLEGCQYYAGACTNPTVTSTSTLLAAINNMKFSGGKNNITLSMSETMTGEYEGLPDSWYVFGGPFWGSAGDRKNVPNVMIVISGADTSNVASARDALTAQGVKVFAVGLSDLTSTQLNAITGNPSNSFSNAPEALAMVAKIIYTTTTTKPTTTTKATTTVPSGWTEWTTSSCSTNCGLCGRAVMRRVCRSGICPGANISTVTCGAPTLCPFGLGFSSCCEPAKRTIINGIITCA